MADDWKVKFVDKDSSDYQIAYFPTKQAADDWIKTQFDNNRYEQLDFEVVKGPWNDSLVKQQLSAETSNNETPQKLKIWFDAKKQAPTGFKWFKSVEDFIDGLFVDIDKDFSKIDVISLDTSNDLNGHSFKDVLNRAENDGVSQLKIHVHGNDSEKKNEILKQAKDNGWEIVEDMKENKKILSEGKHWPTDYIKTGINMVKGSDLGKQSWYNDDFIKKDMETFANEFGPLSHKNSNLGFFSTIVRWFLEYSGNSSQKYQEFIERKLDRIIGTLQVILNDPSYDKIKDEIKQKWTFKQFEELQKKINDEAKASSDSKLSNITKRNDYDLIPIYSYEELHEKFGGQVTGYKGKSEWCHTNGKSTYNSWTKDGTQMFFVLANKKWKEIFPLDPETTNAYDEYGTSLIAILVDVSSGNLLNETLRWNHVIEPSETNPGATVDKAFKNSWGELSQIVGMNVKDEVEKQIKNKQDEIKKAIDDANEKCAQILKNSKIITDVTIPKDIRQLITKVEIPNGVTSIGNYAFYHCGGLMSVTIPDSVTSIGDGAFENCDSLTSVTIPDSVTRIGNYLFRACSGLMSVVIPNSITSIGTDAFQNCKGLTSVTIPNSVMSIETYAFYGCSRLTNITIFSNIKNIGFNTFVYCNNLKEVIFKNKTIDEVKSMENYPFGITDESIIKAEKSLNESKKQFDPISYVEKYKDVYGYKDDYWPKKDYSELADAIARECALKMPFDTEARETEGDVVMLLVTSEDPEAIEIGKRLGDFMMKNVQHNNEKEKDKLLDMLSDSYKALSKLATKQLNESIDSVKIWIDDIRPAPKGYIWLKSVNDFIDWLVEHGIQDVQVIDLDHDAGDYQKDGGDYIKCLDYLESIGADNINVRIHSANPVGAQRMKTIIKKNQWNEVFDVIDEDEVEESYLDGGDYRALMQTEDEKIINEVDVVATSSINPTYEDLINALSKIDPSTPIRLLAVGHEAYTSDYYGFHYVDKPWKIDVDGYIISNGLTKHGHWKCIVRDVSKEKACPAFRLIEWLQTSIDNLDEQLYIWPGFSSKGQFALVDNKDKPTHFHKVASFELSKDGTLDLNLVDSEIYESIKDYDEQLDEDESIDEAEDVAKKDKLVSALKKASKDFQKAASNHDPEQFAKIVVAFDDLVSGVGAYDFKKKKVLKEEEEDINEAAVQKTYGKYGERLKEIIYKKQKWYDPKEVDDVISFLVYSSRDEYLNDYPSDNSQTLRYVLQLAHEKEKKKFEKEQQLKKFNSKAGNSSISGAKLRKDDQYFIPLHEAVNILFAYKPFLSGKNILCNCDDPRASQTFKAIVDNFSSLGIKSATAIGMPPGYETDKQAYMQTIDGNGLGPLVPVNNGGDFRIGESSDLLSKCDVVVSNPPFSRQDGDDIGLFQQFMLKILKANKDVIAIGPLFGVSYDGIKNYIISSKLFAVKSPFQKFGRPDKTDAQVEIDILTNKKDNYNAPVVLFSTFKNDAFGTPIDFSSKTTSELPLVYIDDYASDFPIAINDKGKFSIADSIPANFSEDKRLDSDNNEYILCPISIFRKNWIDVFDVESFPKKIIYNGKELFQGVLLKYKK